MSATIDQRVVEMRFDNKQFESNVSTSMSTIEKLKQKLNLPGAAKGLENVSAAAKGVNMSALGNAVQTVQARFSALQVAGVTALANITNSAVNAGKRIVSALTIDPIKSGFSEYETQINAVQTILANTQSKGSTLTDVNRALDELNTYADKTIYNFTEMTRNIGTFTAAGVDLDTSVSSIKGIANLAAVSGSTSQQASTAMYQLSQALAAGKVQLMDWNSVVNAGMGGQVFQDALKRTAKNMGKDVDALIEKYGSFRESLTQGEWLTTDVLTETLTQLSGAYSEADLIAKGYTESQAKEIMELADTAVNAATKVKTFTQLWDTLKEAAQSGWTQTWEILVGDFGEAKEFLTGISDTLGGMIGASAEARNKVLTEGLSTGWKQLLSQGISDEEAYKDSIKEVAKTHGVAFDEMIEKEGSFDKALKKGLKDGTINSDILTESVTKLADKMRGMSEEELKAAGYTKEHVKEIEALEKGLKDGTISMDEFVMKMNRMSGRENLIKGIKNAFDGLMSVVKPIKEAFGEVFSPITGEQIYSFTERVKNFTAGLKISGETADKIKRAFKGVFSIFDIGKKVVKAVADSFLNLAGSDGVSSLSEFLLNTAASIGDFFTSLNDNFDVTGITDIFSKLASGVSSALGITTDVLSGFGDVLSTIGGIIVKAANAIWSGVKTAFSWISENFSAGDIFAGLAGGGIFVLAKKLTKFVKQISELFDGGILGALFGSKGEDSGSIKDKISEVFDGVGDALQGFTASVKVGSFLAIAASMAILSSAFKNISQLDTEGIAKSLVTMGVSLGIMMKAINGLPTNTKFSKGLTKFSETTNLIKSGVALMFMAKAIDILSDAMLKLSDLSWEEIGKGLVGVGGGIGALCGGLKLINGTKVSLGTSIAMLALAEACKILGDAMQKFVGFSWDEIARGLTGMGGALGELVGALSILSKVGGWGALLGSGGIFIAVQSLGELAESLKSFSGMQWDEIGRGLAGMGGALGELAIALGALSKISTVSVSGGIGAGILGKFGKIGGSGSFAANISGLANVFSAGAIWIAIQGLEKLANALKSFGEMSWSEIGRGLTAMGGALAEVGGVTGAVGKLAGFSSIFGAGAIWVTIQGLADMSDALKRFGSMSWTEIDYGLYAMGGALLEVGTITGALGRFAGFSGILGGAAIWVAVQGLSDLATAFGQFAAMSWSEIGRGLVAMGGALGEVAGISGGLGVLTGFAGILGGASIWIAVQGLGDLADALKKFGEMSWSEIGRGLTAMGSALGDLAIGSLLNTLSGFGAAAIAEVAAPLGDLADSVRKWSGVTVPDGLGWQLAGLAGGLMSFTLGGAGASALSEAAAPLGIMADSVKKWSDVTVPENLSTNLASLASGVKAFTFGGNGAGNIAEAAPGVGAMADSVRKWVGIVVPEDLGTNLSALGTGVKAFTFGGNGAGNLAEAAPGVAAMADSINKWVGITVPEDLSTNLSSLASGVKSFTFGGSGASSLVEAAPGIAAMADSVSKWVGITVPEELVNNLSSLATGVKAFTFGGSGAGSLVEAAPAIGIMADSVKKWVGITMPEELSTNLSTLASAVKAFTLGGNGAGNLAEAAPGVGAMADSVKKWTGISVPEDFVENLKSLASGVKKFTFGGSGAETLSIAATGLGVMADSVKKWTGITIPEDLSTNLSSLASGVKAFTFGGSGAETLSVAASGLSKMADSITKWSGVTIPEGLATNLSTLAGVLDDFVGLDGLTNTITDISSLADATGKLSGVNFGGAADGLSSLSSAITSFSGIKESIGGLGSTIINELVTPLTSASSDLRSAGSKMIESLVSGIKNKQTSIRSTGRTIADTLVKAIKSKGASFESAGETVAGKIATGIKKKYSSTNSAGKYLGDGLIAGINSKQTAAYNAGYTLGQKAAAGVKAGAKINSPSKLTIESGKGIGEGLIVGMVRMGKVVGKAGANLGENAAKSVSSSLSKISNIIESDIDAQPTIRPVLDLSNVRTGADAISGMFGSSVGVTANVGAISTMMNRRSQNGANDDVISAIDKLRDKLNNIGNTTYQVNGITYDDGTNVSNAIQALIRAAKIERRV